MPDDDRSSGDITFGGGISIGRAARARDRTVEALDVSDEAGIDAAALWATLRRLVGAVTVVTARGDEGFTGISVSAFCLVSLEPPLVLACIHADSQVLEAVQAGDGFAVTVLSGRQEFLAETFAGRAPRPDPAFGTIPHRTLVTGAPVLAGGLAWLDCRLHARYPGGDHTIVVGKVVAAGVAADQDDPLLYFASQYRRLGT
jgi:3-hydroxy-9,10-secoandrosta-1,3,5(10)-triene-9,17-dione monooxygenase reductase component